MSVGGLDPFYSGWTAAEPSASCWGPSFGDWERPGSDSQLGRGKNCPQELPMPSGRGDLESMGVLMEGEYATVVQGVS